MRYNTISMKQQFSIHSYSKQELAMLYFKDCNDPHAALNRLNRWIKAWPDLNAEMNAACLNKLSKYFTPKQVGIIVSYLGEP